MRRCWSSAVCVGSSLSPTGCWWSMLCWQCTVRGHCVTSVLRSLTPRRTSSITWRRPMAPYGRGNADSVVWPSLRCLLRTDVYKSIIFYGCLRNGLNNLNHSALTEIWLVWKPCYNHKIGKNNFSGAIFINTDIDVVCVPNLKVSTKRFYILVKTKKSYWVNLKEKTCFLTGPGISARARLNIFCKLLSKEWLADFSLAPNECQTFGVTTCRNLVDWNRNYRTNTI